MDCYSEFEFDIAIFHIDGRWDITLVINNNPNV